MTTPSPSLAALPQSRHDAPLRQYAILAALLLLLGALMLYPLLASAGAAFTDNGRLSSVWFASALRNRAFLGQLLNSLLLAAVVTFLANLLAFPLALIGQHYDFRGKLFWSTLVLAPMILPPFVGAVGLRRLLGTFGSLTVALQHLGILAPHEGVNWLTAGGFWALSALLALSLYPIAYLNLQAALANIDPAMLEAARNLGGRRWGNFWRITLPLAMPGVFAGSTLVFIWAFTELGTPLMIQYPNVVSRAIWDNVAGVTEGRSALGFAEVLIVLAISVTVYVMGKTAFGRAGRWGGAMTSKAAVSATTHPLAGGRALLASLPFAAVTLLALLPHIGVVLYSVTAIAIEPAAGWGHPGEFGWYRTVLPDRYTLEGYRTVLHTSEIYASILNSIKYAGVATLFNLALGLGIAWVLVRTRIRGRVALDGLAMMPLAVPGIVMAFGFIAVLHQWGLAEAFKNGPFWVLVIAYSVRRLPYLVRSAAGGLEQTSVTLEEAAANLGAGPWRVLWRITVPLIAANLIAGALLTFCFSMLEVSDSLILAQLPKHFPITKMIYSLGSDMGGPANVRNACALGVLAMAFMTAMILSARLLLGKRLGALFRA